MKIQLQQGQKFVHVVASEMDGVDGLDEALGKLARHNAEIHAIIPRSANNSGSMSYTIVAVVAAAVDITKDPPSTP